MRSTERGDDVPAEEILPLTLFVLTVVVGNVLGGIYDGLGRPVPDTLPWLMQGTIWLAVWGWFSAYARRHRIPLIFDLGSLFLGFWVFFVPYYLFKTQRWRALMPIGAYVALALISAGVGSLVKRAVSGQ